MRDTKRAALAAMSVAAAGAAWKMSEAAAKRARARRVPKGKSALILGGGFAGVEAARELRRLLPAEALEITLVNDRPALVFTPLLAEAAGGETPAADTLVPLRNLLPDVHFVQGRVTEIDLGGRSATVAIGGQQASDTASETLSADQLIIALGSRTDFHHIPGVEEHSFVMKDARDAARLRGHIPEILERARVENDAARRKALLTIVVGGAGFTGVETMAAVNAEVRRLAAGWDGIASGEIRTILVDAVDRLLPQISEDSAEYARKVLEADGVEIRLSTKVTGAGEGYVELEGERVETRTLIWSGGIEPPAVVKALACKHGNGHALTVDRTLALPGHPGVWAVGDSAVVQKPDGGYYAPLAQNAQKEGAQVAENIVAVLAGEEPKPFRYHPLGELALVGPRAGIAEVMGIHLKGLPAWLLWHAAYLTRMPSSAQRARVALDWAIEAPGLPTG